MARRRVLALLALAAAAAFPIFSQSYLGGFTLALVLCLPVLGLLLSLPAMLGVVVQLSAGQGAVRRGGAAQWVVTVRSRRRLPLARIDLRLRLDNRMTGAHRVERLRLSGASEAHRLVLPADTAHCGMLECRVIRVRVCDCLGLFALRRGRPASAMLPVLPVEAEPEPLPDAVGERAASPVLTVRPGGGAGEEYDLRPYRPGDPIKMIHWKLTSKRDEVILREVLEAQEALPVVALEHLGPPEVMDAVLDRLQALSRALLERQRTHLVRWVHPESGAPRECRVSDARELSRCMGMLLRDPAPPAGRSVLDAAQVAEQSAEPEAVQVQVLQPGAGQGTIRLYIGPLREERQT